MYFAQLGYRFVAGCLGLLLVRKVVQRQFIKTGNFGLMILLERLENKTFSR